MNQFEKLLAAERKKLEGLGFVRDDTPRAIEFYGHMQKHSYMWQQYPDSTVVMDRGGALWLHKKQINMAAHAYELNPPADD